MKKRTQWKIVGCLWATAGILAIISGNAALALFERFDGWRTRTVGILMLFYGIWLIFPKNRKEPEKEGRGKTAKRAAGL